MHAFVDSFGPLFVSISAHVWAESSNDIFSFTDVWGRDTEDTHFGGDFRLLVRRTVLGEGRAKQLARTAAIGRRTIAHDFRDPKVPTV